MPGSGEGGLIATRAATDDHHPGPSTGVGEASRVGRQGCAGITHPAIVAKTGPVRDRFGSNRAFDHRITAQCKSVSPM
ncbi:hypothetical protein GCM10023160_08330 [Brachybacterium paraconglomeratum]